MEVVKTEIGGQELSIETGRMAKLANGAVVVRYGDTMVLCTVCSATKARDGQDFFPLSVEFQEKAYAAGRIPGGYFKREGRLSELEILSCRLIDRPLRPLFPEGFMNETQVVVTVISADRDHEAEVLGLIGASAAVHISDVPFKEAVGAVRLGRINGQFVINPSPQDLDSKSEMNLLIAGTESSIIMVEGSGKEVPEEVMCEGLFFAHNEIKKLVALQNELQKKLGKEKMSWEAERRLEGVEKFVREQFTQKLSEALKVKEKTLRNKARDEIKALAKTQAEEKFSTESPDLVSKTVSLTIEDISYEQMRKAIVEQKTRIDGRDFKTVRPITIETGILPRAHGSVLFTRGETQALVSCTLGSSEDSQRIESLTGAFEKYFILHYNFPGFSVGEAKMMRGPSRRDIGHGYLAERSLSSVTPGIKDFPYTIRLVSDILESNGSSSMATVCGGSLAMMDAGVPGIQPVAGIAMGLIAEGDQKVILTDILGDEDHLGDMDFKVTGTRKGINGFQLDTKISGISLELMQQAMAQAKEARLLILDKMEAALSGSRAEISKFAPQRRTIKVRQSKIKDIIGPGGKNIKTVYAATNDTVKVDIDDSGSVSIFSNDPEMMEKAIQMIEALGGEVEVGRVYEGQVRKIMDFGAFVNIAPGTDGLVHISEIAEERVKSVTDYLNEGDMVKVKVLEIDRQGRIRLSRVEAMREEASSSAQ
ncbi:MAG: polyribonucleotide nucleotidyltransferase [Bradymonadales bacterium]|nr:MAG: polyribonucleotide nucleotidyltransferase [Bradymonadales bacterium]